MRSTTSTLLALTLLGGLVGCSDSKPAAQTQTSPSPAAPISITAPIKKANTAVVDAQQKAQQREQMDPSAQPPSP